MDFKDTGRGILMVLLLISVKITQPLPGPEREVISVYNDNFTTPCNRIPYFIEVYRCVKDDKSECLSNNGSSLYIVQNETEKIEIVVPDTGNKTNFYSYVIYNHTSCTCGKENERKERKLVKKDGREDNFKTVNKTYFNSSYPRNAVNLFTQSDRCNTSQPRYMKHPEFRAIYSKYQYLPYHQCLPGCVVIDYGNVTKVATYKNVGGIKSDSPVFVNITHNKACVAYDSTSKNPTKGEQTADNVLTGGNSLYPESEYQLLVYIGSEKLVIAAFVASLVLFSILIMDFALCRRKKGFIYALFRSDKNDNNNFCPQCQKNNQSDIML